MQIQDHEVAIVAEEPQDNVFSDDEVANGLTDVTVLVRALHGVIVKADVVELGRFIRFFLVDDSSFRCKKKLQLVKQYFDVNGLILVYDITSTDTFEELDDVLRVLQKMVAPDVDICLVGTKADLAVSRMISYDDAEKKSQEHGYSLFETSAATGINCEEALMETLDKMAERRSEVREYLSENTQDKDAPYLDVDKLLPIGR
ncbi:Ras family protein [Cooperia oncophora]